MLVTFRTDAHGDVLMFGDIAVALLKMMGHTGTVPSAIQAADIPAAVARLRQALAAVPPQAPADADDADDAQDDTVSLAHRAVPLIELLTAAARAGEDVLWD